MLGFLIGGLSLIGLVRVLRLGRGNSCGGGWRGQGWHRGWHGHGWHGGHHGWRGGHDGWHGASERGDWWLRGLLSQLDTTPGQEKVIREAAIEVKASLRGARGELDETRRQIASAVKSGTVDEEALGALFSRHDEKLRDVQKAFVGALGKVNAVLDEDQRRRLADMIDRGAGSFRRGGWDGPYRGGAWA